MATLPENWESDYDGDRWFYRYKPTGLIQYIFPKPGDEFPEYVDVFSPPPELSPEEKLESHYQVKRRNTGGGDSSAPKKKDNGLTSATMSGPVDDNESNFWYQPDGLMYMGPGGYTDVSPEADEDEREEVFGKDTEKKGSASPSKADKRSFISPVISAETTPMASSSHPATATPVIEKVTPAAVIVESVPEETQPPESPEVPMLDGRQIYSPVGYMAELPSEHTAQCREETHPAPVELPTHDMMIEDDAQPFIYHDAFPVAPVELPAQSPVVRHVRHTALTTPDQKVLVPPAQHPPQPAPTSAQGFVPGNPLQTYQIPVREHPRASLSTAQRPEPSVVTGPPSPTKYQPYNPERQVTLEREHRRAPVQNDHPYTAARTEDRDSISQNFNRYSLADVPAVLQPPQVPPKRPIERGDDDGYMMPGSNSRHESISDPRLVPSVLQPAGVLASNPRPSLQDQRAQSKPDYRPYHPYQDLEQQIDNTVRLYSPPPPQDRESSVRSVPPQPIQPNLGSTGPDPSDIKLGVNRANTLPTDMPALPFMGIDPSAGNAGSRNYSTPDIRNPDFPVALRTGQNPLQTNVQSRFDQTSSASILAGPSSPDASRKPNLTHQTQRPGSSSFVSPQGQTHTGHTRPVSTQQFHQWQGHSASHRPPLDHSLRPHSVQNLHASSPFTPQPLHSLEQAFKPRDAAQTQVKVTPASERVISSVIGGPSQALSGQQSPPSPDRKARIQGVDSTAGPAAKPSTAARRVSLSNPSHGFVVDDSAMPPPSVQSLRNEGVARQKSPSPQPGPRPNVAAKPRPISMQFPPSQGPVDPNHPNTSSPVRGAPVVQPLRSASPFHQMPPPSGQRGSVSTYTQGPGQQGMWRTASSSPPPQTWQASNRSPATQDRRSPSPSQRISGSAPRPVSMSFQTQQTSPLGQVRNSGAERSERLPAPQPVPVPQPTPPVSQPAGGVAKSLVAKGSQGSRVSPPMPFPHPSPSPRPSAAHQNHPGQIPPRPDKIPGTHASIAAVRHTPAPVPPSQIRVAQAPIFPVHSPPTAGAQTTNGNGYQASQPQSPSATQGRQSRSGHPSSQIQPQPALQQPPPPPSQSRAGRESTDKIGALVASQNYTIASLDTKNVTAPPHMQQRSNPSLPPSPVAVPGTGPPSNKLITGPTPPPSTGMTQQRPSILGPTSSGQASGFTQPGVSQQNQPLNQPAGQFIPQMVGGQQVFYMAPGPVPQQAFVPQPVTSPHSAPSPAVVAVNQPQRASSPVASPQNVAGGKEKERWFGKVFKSGSIKKQNPVTAPAVDDTASQGSGQSVKSETTSRNKLHKSQPSAAHPPQPYVQPMPNVQAQTAPLGAGMGSPIQVMPFVQGNQGQMGQQSGQPSGPYFQPVGGNLYWSNSHHGLATTTPHVVQPNVLHKQPPPGHLITPLVTAGLVNNSQPRPAQQNQPYPVTSPQQNANIVHQSPPTGQPFQPHQQSVDQGRGYFPPVGQIGPSPAMSPSSNSRAGATMPITINQGLAGNNSPHSPVYHRKESVGNEPSQPSSAGAESNTRRPSEPSSISGPRGSLSSPVAPVQVFVSSQIQPQPQLQPKPQPQPQPQPQIQLQAQPEEAKDQEDRESLHSSRKSISSSIAPSFTNSISTDAAFTVAPLRQEEDSRTDVGGGIKVGNPGTGASAGNNVLVDAGSMSMSLTTDDKNNKTKEAAAAVADQKHSTAAPATMTTITPILSGTASVISVGAGNKAAAPAPAPAASNAAATTTTSAYYLAAQRADQLWGGRSRSNSATNAATPSPGSTLAAATVGGGGKGSGHGSPSPLSTSSSSKGPSPSPQQPQAQAQAASTSTGKTAAPQNTNSEKSKWDSSGYDGSGWGDEDEDEYAYGYEDYGSGGGYR